MISIKSTVAGPDGGPIPDIVRTTQSDRPDTIRNVLGQESCISQRIY